MGALPETIRCLDASVPLGNDKNGSALPDLETALAIQEQFLFVDGLKASHGGNKGWTYCNDAMLNCSSQGAASFSCREAAAPAG